MHIAWLSELIHCACIIYHVHPFNLYKFYQRKTCKHMMVLLIINYSNWFIIMGYLLTFSSSSLISLSQTNVVVEINLLNDKQLLGTNEVMMASHNCVITHCKQFAVIINMSTFSITAHQYCLCQSIIDDWFNFNVSGF